MAFIGLQPGTTSEITTIGGGAITSTAAELNILDGVTATAAELNILDGVTATATELNILDGVTSTTAELNILDGVTSTATELNLVDGSTADTVVNSKAVIYGSAGQITANELDVDNIQIDGNAVKSTNSNGNIQLFPNGTGFTELYGNTNAGAIRFNCEFNSHGVTLKGPPHSANATYTLELPNADGSAGQLIKTDGNGKLSFVDGAASAGLRHLSTVTASGASTVDIETTFDSTYDAYKLIISDMTVSSDGAQIRGQMKIGGSYITSGTYDFLHRRLGVDTTGQIYGDGFGTSSNIIVAQSVGNDSHASANFEFNIYNPTDTAIRHVIRFLGSYYEDDNDIHHVYGIGQNSTTGALTGIRFSLSTGTISGKFRLYGITNG